MVGNKRQNGFSLIEILISISVLLIVLGGVTSMAVGIVKTSATNKYQIEAYSQAQKQLELAKQYRNTNNLDGDNQTSWNSNIFTTGNHSFDIDNNGKVNLANRINHWTSPATGKRYGVATTFSKVNSSISDQRDLLVTTNVSWQERGNEREIELKTTLTNWYWTYE